MTKRLCLLDFLSFLLISTSTVLASFHSPRSSQQLKSSRGICLDDVRAKSCASESTCRLYSVSGSSDPFSNLKPLLGNIFQSSSNNLQTTTTAAKLREVRNAAMNAEVVDSHSTVLEQGGIDINSARTSVDAFDKLDFGTTIKLSDYSKPPMDFNPESISEMLTTKAQALQSIIQARPPAEDILRARDDFREWGNSYFSSISSTYKLPELYDAMVGGKFISESVDSVVKIAQDSIVAMDFEKNTPIYLLLLTFFWASDQRRVGLERGKKMSEAKISSLETQLKAAEVASNLAEVEDLRRLVDAANEEKLANAAGIQDLQLKMESLQSQVEALTSAAQEAKKQTVLEDKLVSPEPTKSIEIVVPEPPQSIEVEQEADEAEVGVLKDDVNVAKTTSKLKGGKAATSGPPAAQKRKVIKKVKTSAKKTTTSTPKTKKSSKTKTKGKTKAAAKMKTKTEDEIPAKSDWGRLSESTLRRKTVKELTGYLETKGVQCTDDNGKTLKKNLLVDLVLS